MNRTYITSTLCVNRNVPDAECNGHCYLAKELKKDLPAASGDQNTERQVQNLSMLSPHLAEAPDGVVLFYMDLPGDRSLDGYFQMSRYVSAVYSPPKDPLWSEMCIA